MEWRRPMQAQGFEMVGSAVAFVAREAVLRVDGVPLLHARVAVRFREDGSGGDGNAAGVAFDQGFLLDQNVELHGVDEQIVWRNSELLERGGHGLARGLVNIPGVDALRVDFSDGPAQRVLLDTDGQLGAAFSGKFFRVVEADDAPLGIENHRGGDDGAKQRAASGFINAGDAQPAQLARRSLETGGAESAHYPGDFSTAGNLWTAEWKKKSLLVPQSHYRVDAHGAPRGNPGGQECYGKQKKQSRNEKERIVRANIEEQGLQETRAEPGSQKAERRASNGPAQHVRKNQLQDSLRRGAKGDANADFASLLRDEKSDDAVNADSRQQDANACK